MSAYLYTMMHEQRINKDVRLLCAKATSFPQGIMEAFARIEQANPDFCLRTFYGLSRGNRVGGIDYWACVEAAEGEKHPSLEVHTVKAGRYLTTEVGNFREQPSAIGEAFRQMLKHPELDRESYCVEEYHAENVKCMVKLKQRDGNLTDHG